MAKFTTTELIAKVANDIGESKSAVDKVYKGIIEATKEMLKDQSKDGVSFHSFCDFNVVHMEAKERRNPSTGETFMAEACDIVRPKMSNKIKKFDY